MVRNGLTAIVGAGMLLASTPDTAGAREPMDPPAGVVFMQATLGPAPAPPDDGARPRSPALDRVARGLRDAAAMDAGRRLRPLQFEVRVFGETPRLDVLEGFDIGPLSPVAFGPPTHAEWLVILTPPAFRSTAPFRPVRERRSLGW